jgi:hypothetical protein
MLERRGCFDTTDQEATLNWVTSLLALDLKGVFPQIKVRSEDKIWLDGIHAVSNLQGIL